MDMSIPSDPIDAEIVSGAPGIPADDTAVNVLLDLENLIKTHITNIDQKKDELKKLREMLTSALSNDETYSIHEEEAKKAAKLKNATKLQILKLPANAQLNERVKGLGADVKELDESLSEYLREYQRMSGASEIEGNDGEVREIIYIAKLIKKSSRGKK